MLSLKQELRQIDDKCKITDNVNLQNVCFIGYRNSSVDSENMLLLDLLYYRFRDGFRNNLTFDSFRSLCNKFIGDYDDFEGKNLDAIYAPNFSTSKEELIIAYGLDFFGHSELTRDRFDEVIAKMQELNQKELVVKF